MRGLIRQTDGAFFGTVRMTHRNVWSLGDSNP